MSILLAGCVGMLGCSGSLENGDEGSGGPDDDTEEVGTLEDELRSGGGKVRVTWYSAADNDPPGTYAVAYSSLASNGRDAKNMGYADGAGTKDNPVALAQPKGSKKIKKGGYYTIQGEGDKPFCGRVVDTCAACRDSGGAPRLDVFVGKNSKGHPKWDYASVKKGC